ncbi:MAG: D-glycero-alpha-D-manno-heptose-1,7-bisphosphate 7-phosphatase [Candidatus Anammoxibacter sp.]
MAENGIEMPDDLRPKNKAIFLDRDGTIIVGLPYLSSVDQIKLNYNAAEGIKEFNEKGYLVIIITNQSGIARGYFNEERLREINEELKKQLYVKGAKIDAIYYCPHMPEGEITDDSAACQCRKPKPGMIQDAATKYNVDLKKSLMVGDTPGDILAGKNAGCKTAIIDKGKEFYDIKRDTNEVQPDYIVKNLHEVAMLLPI